ncbi:MAG: TIGR03960 family B12-binding radical SAM protein [Bacillota bacterium]
MAGSQNAPQIWEKIENSLNEVSKPGRYIGGEYNIRIKDWTTTGCKVALAFPDVYEIGLSHLGLRILYELINAQPDMLAERVYAPWPDFQSLLRRKELPLYSLENKRGLNEFDVLGFSLQYELSYTNVLTMLELGRIPLYSRDRTLDHPLVIGGGPCTFNPEPMADFFDCFLIGEAEDVMVEILETVRRWKSAHGSKETLLRELEKIEGIYVPSHFEFRYHGEGTIAAITSLTGHYPSRAIVRDFSKVFTPEKWLVPYLDIVHDRVALEIQRGCTRGCRFCQAGMIYRPVREKPPEAIMNSLKKLVADTGYEELSLTSLSSADYSRIDGLIDEACGCLNPLGVNVSLPSLRIDSFSIDLATRFQSTRKGSLTFAPEAGTDRLRSVINKGVTAADLLTASEAAFKAGWQKLKLYFMIGLPTETMADLEGIVELVAAVLRLGKSIHPRTNSLRITASISTFVPKAHTPFQWRQQITIAETIEKQHFLQEQIRGRHLELNWHDPTMSRLEGILARGDRRLSSIIHQAWQKGAQFDGWSDQFRYPLWMEVFQENRLDPDFYTRARSYDEILPWSHINTGLGPEFLRNEDVKAGLAQPTLDCRNYTCANCGVCPSLKVKKHVNG